jgi:hypothetical protein
VIQNKDGIVTVVCEGDNCTEVFEGTDDFRETLGASLEEGWKHVKGEMQWHHYCPTCVVNLCL